MQKSFLPVGKLAVSVQDLKLARDVLEIGVEHSILVKDVCSFERYISQLKSYYYDYKWVLWLNFDIKKNPKNIETFRLL